MDVAGGRNLAPTALHNGSFRIITAPAIGEGASRYVSDITALDKGKTSLLQQEEAWAFDEVTPAPSNSALVPLANFFRSVAQRLGSQSWPASAESAIRREATYDGVVISDLVRLRALGSPTHVHVSQLRLRQDLVGLSTAVVAVREAFGLPT